MRKTFWASALALASLTALPLTAQAQSVEVGPRGFRVEPYDNGPRSREDWRDRREGIDEREAISIARNAGMERRLRVSGGHGRDWRVLGLDRFGREIRFVIDDRTGRILSRDRD